MISKKRYWGLALPIYDCAACGTFDVVGGREELRGARGRGLGGARGPHAPPARTWTRSRSPARAAARRSARIPDVGNPWLDAGIVPFSTLHYREDPAYWEQWFPADFITESFPGQFRNWFYSMLAMSTVLRREAPFRTIFGYATLFGEDGRPMHKSWGNAIEFDEAAERMGVDVMRWMYANARPRRQHPVRLARGRRGAARAARPLERLRLLRHLRPAGRLDARRPRRRPSAERPRSTAGSCRACAGLAARVGDRLGDFDADAAARGRLRLHRRALHLVPAPDPRGASRGPTTAPTGRRRSPRSTRPWSAWPGCSPRCSRSCPRRCTRTSSCGGGLAAPDSVHLTRWPADELAGSATPAWKARWRRSQRAVELARTLRAQAGLRTRQPLARLWIALPGGDDPELDALLDLVADEVNVRRSSGSATSPRSSSGGSSRSCPGSGRSWAPRSPRSWPRPATARSRSTRDGSRGAGRRGPRRPTRWRSWPRRGRARPSPTTTAWWSSSTPSSTDALRAEGDARELQRAIQDLRRDAGLELDDRIDLVVAPPRRAPRGSRPSSPAVAAGDAGRRDRRRRRRPDGWRARDGRPGGRAGAAIALRRRGGRCAVSGTGPHGRRRAASSASPRRSSSPTRLTQGLDRRRLPLRRARRRSSATGCGSGTSTTPAPSSGSSATRRRSSPPLSVGVIALIVWYHGRGRAASGWLATLALGLLLGGAVGNLIDRIRLGYVVDFVDMGIPAAGASTPGTWPTRRSRPRSCC